MAQDTFTARGSTQDSLSISTADQVRMRLARLGIFLPLAIVLIYLCALYLYPITRTLRTSLFDPGFTLEHYRHFFGVAIYFNRLIFTLKIALGVAILCVLLGYPVAYLLTNVSSSVRNIVLVMIVIPMWISILVRTYAWMVLLGREGLLNQILQGIGLVSSPVRLMHNTFAVFFGMVSILLPYTILPMYSVMNGIDRNLLKAAQNLGANSFQTFRRIFFPLSLPGVAAGALLVFILALGFYITPALLGGPSDIMLANLIDIQTNKLLKWEFGSAISVVLLSVSLTLFYFYNRYLGLDRLMGGLT